MKKIYSVLSVLLIGSQVSMAQLTLTQANNQPVVGDVNNTQKCDSTAAIPKSSGAGMSWNFNSCFSMNTATEVVTYTTVAASPSPALFSQANMASVRNNSSWEFWKTSAPMIEYAGNYDPNGNDALVLSNLITWNLWPTTFNTTSSDAFTGAETANTGTASWSGNYSYTAAGTGTVTLPGGNVHTNCLQIVKTITIAITSGTAVTNMTFIHYEYWSSACKFPIIDMEYQTQTTGTVVTKKVDVWVNKTAQTVGLKELEKTENNMSVFPNPANEFINVILPGNGIASKIEILDINGRVVAGNTNSNSIDVATLPKAVYLVRVSDQQGTHQKRLVISK